MIKKLLFGCALSTSACFYAQTVVFTENFDDATAVQASWQNIDRDGDGSLWTLYNAEESYIPEYTGNCILSLSYSLDDDIPLTVDDAIVSPVIKLPTNEGTVLLKFRISGFDDAFCQNHYAVYAIPATSSFTGEESPIFEETLDLSYAGVAKDISIDITEFAGQEIKLVFRHYDSIPLESLYVAMDDIFVYAQGDLKTSNITKANFTIYPNPTADFLKISGLPKVNNVKIFDLSGNKVLENSSNHLDVRNLVKGTYLINIYHGNSVETKKFIKN